MGKHDHSQGQHGGRSGKLADHISICKHEAVREEEMG